MDGLKMIQKSLFLMCIAAAAAMLSVPAWAESTAPHTMDPAALGRLDAMLTQCAKADAKHRTTYERYRTEMIVFGEGTAQEMRVTGSDTPKYKEAYQALTTEMGQKSKDDLAAQCAKVIDAES